MTANHSPDAAVDDADLVRYLDGELDEHERARVDDAVAREPALAGRLQQLRARSARLSALLTGSDPRSETHATGGQEHHGTGAKIIVLNAAWAAQQGVPARIVPPPRPLPGWLRAAAVIGVLFGGALLVPPVRAWISGLLQSPNEPGEIVTPAGDPTAAIPIDTLGIRFASGAETFTIEFAAEPREGSLTAEWVDGDSAAVQSFTAGGSVELARVRDDRVRVDNRAATSVDFRLMLPASVVELRIRVPGRPDLAWRPPSAGARRRVFDLGADSR